MKTLALATTALVMGASSAMADVRISGYGRFGLDYNEANDNTVAGETNITSRLRLQFDMSTETDGGITFGARFRAQAESRDGVAGGADFNGARFFASVGGFTVQVGNIAGALDSMPGLYLETRSTGIGIDGADFTSLVTNVGPRSNYDNWDAYSSGGSGRNGVEVIYEQGPFSGHLSYSKDNDIALNVDGLERTAVNVAYTFGDWTAALGYQDSNAQGEDRIVATIFGDLGRFGVRFAYANNQDAGTNAQGNLVDVDKFGLYGSYDIGAATTLVGFVTNEDNPDETYDGTGFGFNVSHDLGGGVSIEAGAVQGSDDITQVQAGVWFSF